MPLLEQVSPVLLHTLPTEYSLNQDKSPSQAIHSKFAIWGYAAKTAYDIIE
jgi:hypothetical protein